jgi:hypothetical protein
MKTASVSLLKKELSYRDKQELEELCIKLIKYKKENKELLSYLLFDSINDDAFIINVKQDIDELFELMNRSSVYLIKKSLRKILRFVNRYIKYTGDKRIEVELRIYFCKKIKEEKIPTRSSLVLSNLYNKEVERIKTACSKLHEDIQFDYSEIIETL